MTLDISIHAPTRGATAVSVAKHKLRSHFNPRTHKGCDAFASVLLARSPNFNPRTHKGCDFGAVHAE